MADPYGTVVRVFHALIGILVIVLACVGFSIFFRHDIGLAAYKSQLLNIHIWTAYTLLATLTARIILALCSKDPRTHLSRALLSLRSIRGLPARMKARTKATKLRFAGRTMLSRGLVSAFLLAGCIMIPTGLIRAGTDLYHFPLGGFVKSYVAQDGVATELIKAGSKEGTNPYRLKRVVKAKILVGKAHIYTGFFVVFLMMLHMLGQFTREWTTKTDTGKRRGFARIMLFGPGRKKPKSDD